MMGNRYTALVDACSLVSALGRNTMLSLAEAELFRVRWSNEILDETERALREMLDARGFEDATARSARAVRSMRQAFPESSVERSDTDLLQGIDTLRDPGDAHVIVSAIACQASVIVTENVRDFKVEQLDALSIEVKTADAFIADTIDLDRPRSAASIARMRRRFKRPELDVDALLLRYEGEGFLETSDILRTLREQLQ